MAEEKRRMGAEFSHRMWQLADERALQAEEERDAAQAALSTWREALANAVWWWEMWHGEILDPNYADATSYEKENWESAHALLQGSPVSVSREEE